MKKLVVLSILVLGFMMFGMDVKGGIDPIYLNQYNVNDNDYIELSSDINWTYAEDFDRLQIIPQDTNLIVDIGGTDWLYFNDTSFEQIIRDQLSPFDGVANGTYEFTEQLYINHSSSSIPLTTYYNTLSIYFKDGDEFRFTISELNSTNIVIEFSVEYEIESELLTQMGTGFEIESVYGTLENDANELLNGLGENVYFQIYLSYIPQFDMEYDHVFVNGAWAGYDSETLATNLDFTQNYFIKYVNTYIAPFARTEAHLTASINAYVDLMKTNGIYIPLPENFNVALMVPQYWLEGLGYWYDLNKSVNFINIKVPDLTWEGQLDIVGGGYQLGGEIWGETLVYTVDLFETYTYSMLDLSDNVMAPVFGIFLDIDYYVISFNTSGGSLVPNQFIGEFGTILTPTPPTRANYEFLGWERCPYTQDGCSNVDTEWNYEKYEQRTQEILASRLYVNLETLVINRDTSFIAIWSPIWRSVSLVFNGGIRKPLNNFTSNTLIVKDGDLISQNYFDVPFGSNMLERTNYAFEGWYIDEAFTSEFNPSTPITENFTLYANWELRTASVEAPDLLTTIIGSMGLADFFGYFLLYVFFLIVLIVILAKFSAPIVLYFIGITGLSALWIFLGFFTFAVTIIIVLLLTSIFVGFYKLGGGTDE